LIAFRSQLTIWALRLRARLMTSSLICSRTENSSNHWSSSRLNRCDIHVDWKVRHEHFGGERACMEHFQMSDRKFAALCRIWSQHDCARGRVQLSVALEGLLAGEVRHIAAASTLPLRRSHFAAKVYPDGGRELVAQRQHRRMGDDDQRIKGCLLGEWPVATDQRRSRRL
jgi:hypothetical protein